ncbi:AAA family ATPase [Devosia sp. MC521]|uniref:AAA family ATPase n=1 Tax=Devosia sp. MC521 TaxID=2759954 RepID=UPI0015FC01D8|nr:AAA family ATPase [Devosia sp. MC521]MBJ6986046.1 (d)CMP kinase [Devosia sp. MC521]QMW61416.1 (d)CMP kinase [Devosia sp. MC521]
MAITNFGPGRCATLIKNLVKAWPWEATPVGHDWWVDFCSRLDQEGDVTEGIEIQAPEYTGVDAAALDEAVQDLRELREIGSFDGAGKAWDILDDANNARRTEDRDSDDFDAIRVAAGAGADHKDLQMRIYAREGWGDLAANLAALLFLHRAKQTRQLPPPAAATTAPELDVGAIQQLLQVLVAGAREGVVTQAELPELVRQHSQIGIAQVEVNLKGGPQVLLEDGPYHERFPLVLQCIAARQNVALIGPAGSGKTTMAEQVAKALGLSFYFSGAIESEYTAAAAARAWGVTRQTVYAAQAGPKPCPPAILRAIGLRRVTGRRLYQEV